MQAEARPPRPSTADRQQELPSRHGHSPRAHHRRQRSDPGGYPCPPVLFQARVIGTARYYNSGCRRNVTLQYST